MDLLVVLLVLSEVLRLRLDSWGCVWLWKTCLSFEQWLIKSWLHSFFLYSVFHKGEFYLERFLMRQHCIKQFILVIFVVYRLWSLEFDISVGLWMYRSIGHLDFDFVNVWNCDLWMYRTFGLWCCECMKLWMFLWMWNCDLFVNAKGNGSWAGMACDSGRASRASSAWKSTHRAVLGPKARPVTLWGTAREARHAVPANWLSGRAGTGLCRARPGRPVGQLYT